jgi:hypothetical protein
MMSEVSRAHVLTAFSVVAMAAFASNSNLLVSAVETEDYTPTDDVKAGHELIHWSPISADSRELDYLYSTIFPAAVITVLGLVSVVLFQLILCARWCMRSFKCCGVSKTTSSYRGNLMILMVLLFTSGIAVHMLFIGNSGVNDGFVEAADGIGTLKDEFVSLKSNAATLTTLGTEIKSDAASCTSTQTCAQYYCCTTGDCNSGGAPDTTLQPMFQVFDVQGALVKTVGDALTLLVADVPDALDTAETVMRGQAVDAKNNVIYGVYAGIIVVLVGYAASAYFKHKIGTQIMILLSEIIVVVLTLTCGVCMFLVTILGDFCMDPSGNVIDLITETSNSTEILDILNYYLKCVGTSPIGSDLDEGTQALEWVVGNITSYDSFLGSGNDPTACRAEIDSISSQSSASKDALATLIQFFGCTTVNNAWAKIVNEGLCTSGYSGFYALWICLYIISLTMFFMMCISAILFKQYEYQSEGFTNEDGEISYDANDQAFLDNPGIQMTEYEGGSAGQIAPQQGENFNSPVYGKAV